MHLSIKGRLKKINGEWVSEFTHLNIRMKAPSPLKAIRAATEFITSQLEGKNSKYSVRLDEDGVFYFSTSTPRPLIKFVALCLTKNYSELNYEQLDEWFTVED